MPHPKSVASSSSSSSSQIKTNPKNVVTIQAQQRSEYKTIQTQKYGQPGYKKKKLRQDSSKQKSSKQQHHQQQSESTDTSNEENTMPMSKQPASSSSSSSSSGATTTIVSSTILDEVKKMFNPKEHEFLIIIPCPTTFRQLLTQIGHPEIKDSFQMKVEKNGLRFTGNDGCSGH